MKSNIHKLENHCFFSPVSTLFCHNKLMFFMLVENKLLIMSFNYLFTKHVVLNIIMYVQKRRI